MHEIGSDARDLLIRWLAESARPSHPGARHRQLSEAIRALPEGDREAVADIMQRVVVQSTAPAGEPPLLDRRTVAECMGAFVRSRAIVVRRGTGPSHCVEPHGVLIRSPHWYLMCTYRDTSVVTFLRLDSIDAVAPVLHGGFLPRAMDQLLLLRGEHRAYALGAPHDA